MKLSRKIITVLAVSSLIIGLIAGYLGFLFFSAFSPQLSSFKGNAEYINLIGQNYSSAKFKADDIFFNTNETVYFTHVKNITIESDRGETRLINYSSLQVQYARDIPQSLSNIDIAILFENLTMKGSLTNLVQLYGYMNNMELKSNGEKVVIQRPWVVTVKIGAEKLEDFSSISFEIDNTSSVESHLGIIKLGVWYPSDLIVSVQQPSKIILRYGEGELGLNSLNNHKFEVGSVDILDIDLIPNYHSYQSNLLINGTRLIFDGATDSAKLNNENKIMSEASYWFNTKPEALFSGLTMIFTFVLAAATVVLAIVSYLQVRASNKQISENRLMRKIEKHNEQLINLFKSWRSSFPRPPRTGFDVYTLSHDPFKDYRFEDDPLFSDLEHHLPPKFKDLMKKWSDYQDLRHKYYKRQTEIIDKITDLISKMQKEDADYDFHSESVYLKAIELLTGKKYYDYESEEAIHAEPTTYRLFYRLLMTAVPSYNLTKESALPKEKIDKIKEKHENVSNIVIKEYEKDIRNLIDIENKLKDSYRELYDSLDVLTRYPEYNNMNCEFIFPRG